MKTYHLKPDSFYIYRDKSLKKSLPLVVFVLVGGLLLFAYLNAQDDSDADVSLPLLAVMMCSLIGFSLFRSIKKQQRAWQSYRLKIGEGQIVREQAKRDPIEIQKENIEKIHETEEGDLLIHTKDSLQFIAIPHYLEKFQEARAELAQMTRIESSPISSATQHQTRLIWAILSLTAMATIVISDSPLIILPLGSIMLFVMLRGLIKAWRLPNVPAYIKRSSLLVLLPVFIVIYRMAHLFLA